MAVARSSMLARPVLSPFVGLSRATRTSSSSSLSVTVVLRAPGELRVSGRGGRSNPTFRGGAVECGRRYTKPPPPKFPSGDDGVVVGGGGGGNRPSEVKKNFKKTGVRVQSFLSMAAAAASSSSQTTSVDESTEFKVQEQILTHQKAAAKLPAVEESRTLVYQSTLGTLSTISKRYDGYPVGSIVNYATEEDGSVILSISSLAPHTRDLELNPKCSLLVPKDPSDKSDTIVTITGDAERIPEQEESSVRTTFLQRHPGAFWVDFGDFRFVRIHPKRVRYVSGLVTGLAAVAEFTGEQFQSATVDPISHFTGPIAGHMNKDHGEQTAQIVENSLKIKVDTAIIRDVDRLGFSVLAKREGATLKLRIPFPRPAEDRKDVKNLIIEMLTSKRD